MSIYGVPGLRDVKRRIRRHDGLNLTYTVEVLLVFNWLPIVRVGRNQPITAKGFWNHRMEARLNRLIDGHRHEYSGRNVRLFQTISLQDMVHGTKTPARLADAVMKVFGSSYRTPPDEIKKERRKLERHTKHRYEVHLRHVQFLMMILSTRPESSSREDDLVGFTMEGPTAWQHGLDWLDRSILWHENVKRRVIEIGGCSSKMTREHVLYAIRQHMSAVGLLVEGGP